MPVIIKKHSHLDFVIQSAKDTTAFGGGGAVAEVIIAGHADDLTPQDFLTESEITELREVFAHAENIDRLGPIKEMVGAKFTYPQLPFFRAFHVRGLV